MVSHHLHGRGCAGKGVSEKGCFGNPFLLPINKFMNNFNDRQFKINGLNHSTSFERDSIEEMNRLAAQKFNLEEQQRLAREREKNKVFDPDYMDINLPIAPGGSQPGGISFDPDDMKFNF